MDSVNQTLYIPLYGKAYVSRKGILLSDHKAEEIWAAEGFALRGKAKSKWLAYYMAMRAAVFDRWLRERMAQEPDAVIVHVGCGLDSRNLRVGTAEHLWFDMDFPDVIAQRKRYYSETGTYKMLPADLRDPDWLAALPSGKAIVVMEGVSMYLTPRQLKQTLKHLQSHFSSVDLLMDCYTRFAARASKVRNPINEVGVTQVYGLDDPHGLEAEGIRFVKAHTMTPADLVEQLRGVEKGVFRTLYAGAIAEKMYRLYEFAIGGAGL